ncbi:hypothetical protein AB0I66_35170 [Streptomyces sp. NPDC050439]|uniref:hypothetical protein n=1 Tax=unclassified Streptomyces TaxID=2593676 RepID=UPI003446D432
MGQQTVPVVANELNDPRVALLGRLSRSGEHVVSDTREALVPFTVVIAPDERLHDLFGLSGQDHDFGESAHPLNIAASPHDSNSLLSTP